MLVLSRKAGEQILIGDDIVVTVLEVRGEGVKIGIDAPRGLRIQRQEVVAAVSDANVEAARSADPATEEKLRALLGMTRPADD
ncbi:carbon storage regulator CsrA [Arthrobacter sp.]|uniref:carbon storage regulator CsrA n=1 Tax=Arthrobacter sp. TaxID=1667 RepID=UPI003A951454